MNSRRTFLSSLFGLVGLSSHRPDQTPVKEPASSLPLPDDMFRPTPYLPYSLADYQHYEVVVGTGIMQRIYVDHAIGGPYGREKR